jgi:hypothetical protein
MLPSQTPRSYLIREVVLGLFGVSPKYIRAHLSAKYIRPACERGRGAPLHTPRPHKTTPLTVSPEVLEAAVEKKLEEHKREQFDQVKNNYASKVHQRVATVVDALIAEGVLSEVSSTEVEAILQREVNEVWEIKEAAHGGYLQHDDAVADYKTLRYETDESLLEYLSEDELKTLRTELDAK